MGFLLVFFVCLFLKSLYATVCELLFENIYGIKNKKRLNCYAKNSVTTLKNYLDDLSSVVYCEATGMLVLTQGRG